MFIKSYINLHSTLNQIAEINGMAAAFKVTNSSEIATAFAAHDEFLSRVAMKANDGQAMTKGMVESTIYYDIFYLLLSFT